MEVQEFLERDYQRIKSLLSNGGLFLSVQNEEKAIQNAVSHLENASKQLLEQQKNQIDQKFHVKMDSISALLSKLKKASSNIGALNQDDINRLETALGEMLQILELQKKHELAENETAMKAKKEANIEDYKSRTEPALERHFEEAKEKMTLAVGELEPLEQYYETASLQSEKWDQLETNSLFPLLNSIRLGERIMSVDCGNKEIELSYSIPEIVPFFTKKSLSIVYKREERHRLKDVVDSIFVRGLMAAKSGYMLFHFMDPMGKGELFLDYLNFGQQSTKQILNNKIITSGAEIDDAMRKLVATYDDIEQNYLKGMTLEQYNLTSKIAIPYRIVVIDAFPLGLSVNAMEMIKKMLRYEITAGLHFVLLVEESLLPKIGDMLAYTTVFSLAPNFVIDSDRLQVIKKNVLEFTDLNYNVSESASFEECFSDKEWWKGDCSNFTTVPLGLSKAVNYDLEFDEEAEKGIPTAHMVIAGQTGCGKSFLLHSMIIGMSILYSPDDLKFFLIDLKGAEFKQYDTYKLPHAEFIAINGNPEFGLHVLRIIKQKMNERTDEFKAKGVERLPEYRKMFPDVPMPRYFIIIDEYQRMLSGGGLSREARFLIEDITKVGRALGFNLVLASQSVLLDSDVLGNFTHRIAMRCTQFIAHQVLGRAEENSPDLKVGQAIVHQGRSFDVVQSYFLPKQADNSKGMTKTRVDYLKEIASRWEAQCNGEYENNTIVFDGESRAYLGNNRTVSRMIPEKIHAVKFSPGEKILVDGRDLMSQLDRDIKYQNILAVGGKPEVSLRAMNGCLMSMINQFESNEVEIDMLNFINKSKQDLYETIKDSSMQIIQRMNKSKYFEMESSLEEWMDDLLQDIDKRKEALNSNVYFAPRIVAIYQADNRNDFQQIVVDPSRNKYKHSELTSKLLEVLANGSEVGVHCLMYFSNPDAFFKLFDASEGDEKDLALFGHRILLQMEEKDSKIFLHNSKDASRILDRNMKEEHADNRAIYYNVYSNHFETIKPYEFYQLTN